MRKQLKVVFTLLVLISQLTLGLGGVMGVQAKEVGATALKTYYVDGSKGSDLNSGTLEKPWQTIQKAATAAPLGSRVIVLAGNYPERVTIKRAKNIGYPLIFEASGRVVMRGFTILTNYVTIKGFEITDTPDDTREGWGIFVNASYCQIENNYIYYATHGGINLYVEANNYAQIKSCTISGNRLYRNAMAGMIVTGRNHTITNNEIWGTIQHHPKMAVQPAWLDADGIHFHGSGHVFRGNYIHDITFADAENVDPHIDCFQTFVSAPLKEAASNILFEQNTCDNVQVQNAEEVGKGFMLQGASNITIRNNLIKSYTGVNANSGTNGLVIINNTFVSDPSLPTAYYPIGIVMRNLTGATVYNNLFYNLPGHIIYLESVQSLSSGRNLAYRDDGKALWTTNTYSPQNDLWNVNPLLVSPTDYHLSTGSPAIDAGAKVTLVNDFEGNVRPNGAGFDIGAYEFIH